MIKLLIHFKQHQKYHYRHPNHLNKVIMISKIIDKIKKDMAIYNCIG